MIREGKSTMQRRLYNPAVREFVNWANAMSQVLGTTFAPYDYALNGGSNGSNGSQPQATRLPLDVWSNDEAFQIAAYVPGVNPEDVEIVFEGDELTIRGRLPQPQEGANYVMRELFHGSFERRISFNVPVDADKIEATFHNGLLSLVVPKAEAVRPKQIKVQAK
jgi:HSP20 family protein